MGAKIPMYTLHRKIHETIHDIPCPNEDVCELIWHELESLRFQGFIDCQRDNIELRLDTIIHLLTEYGDNATLDVTIATLKWEKQVVRKFYQNPH